jgi:hypothetical protein
VASPSLILHGAAVGLEEVSGLTFRSDRPYTGCCICGAVFQSDADRDPVGTYQRQPAEFGYNLDNVDMFALGLRKEWSKKHEKTHTEKEHDDLAKSGYAFTPEAANKLAAFGTIPLTLSEEINAALLESSPIPLNDAEGT